jgi:hypothetical protein
VRRRVAVSAMLFVGVVLLGVAIVIWSTVTLLAGSASGASGQRRRESDRVAGEIIRVAHQLHLLLFANMAH